MIKMIALDMDNTLLNSKKEISERNTTVLKKLHDQGIKVVLCTGRPINAIWNYIEQLGLTEADDYTITFNGGLVINNTTKESLFRLGMSYDKLKPVYDYAKAGHFPMNVLNFSEVFELTGMDTPSYYSHVIHNIAYHKAALDDLPKDDLYSKIIMSAQPEVLDRAEQNVPEDIQNDYHVTRSQPVVLEYLPPKVDKALGLEKLLQHFGMTFANLMTFGDGDNDLGMTKAAVAGNGLGVAMANSIQAMKDAANVHTSSNDDDGVADYLEKYFATKL